MNKVQRFALFFLLAFALVAGSVFLQHTIRRLLDAPIYNPNPWVTGYLPAYRQSDDGIRFMRRQDYAMLTHLAHASFQPLPDGTLDEAANVYTPEHRQQAVQAARATHRPVLLVIMGSYETFSAAIRPDTRQMFIHNILRTLDTDGYDGVDIDMEPITRKAKTDNPDFIQFIKDLHKALQTRHNPRLGRPPLLTAAVSLNDRHVMAKLYPQFDQINIMTYDMAQPYTGWVPWFDSALHNGDFIFPGHTHEVPSVENWVEAFLDAGIPRRKLGIGISLDVACWQGGIVREGQGVTQAREPWVEAPQYFKRSYAEMSQSGWMPTTYRWDKAAQMAWFSVDSPDPAQDMFCNFNDPQAIAAKLEFVREQGLGGLIVWELALDQDDTQPNKPPPLRNALREALAKPNRKLN
ncbi:MAG: glycoside hydrolase family 18 protein [Thiothrix sp.]|uniref:glycosyl hydrolase family 18 protein n=1 Tax=Thiothrix sp. TaxID=1032 RepID=UPI002632B94A|nr:glycoside hydrolase family 18 protein [Thiothrix sp.]MDD5393119.1 glycoside hydrolase family 18 protein [Thiothrix sp.]